MSIFEALVSDNKNCKDKLQKLMREDVLDENYYAYVSHEVLEITKGDEIENHYPY